MLVDALGSIDLMTETDADVVILPDGSELRVHVASVARPDLVRRMLAEASPSTGHVLVADQVPEAGRAVLEDAGWGWLDRRGHLRLRHGTYWIDVDVPALPRLRAAGPTDPISGAVAFGAAAAALRASPQPLEGVRATARLLGASPAATSDALAAMRDAGLLTRDLRSVDPDLFWALTGRFPTEARSTSGDLRGLVPLKGVVAVGTRAGAALGLLPASADYPIELLVADVNVARTVGRLVQRGAGALTEPPTLSRSRSGAPAHSPSSSGHSNVAVRLITAPHAFLVTDPMDLTVDGVPVAPAHTVAMSLAIDPARGAEVVERWEHPSRVW